MTNTMTNTATLTARTNTNTNTDTDTGAEARTVDTLTPRKADQKRARAVAGYAYGEGARWTYGDIFAAYTRPSKYKVGAWEDCKALCAAFNGRGLVIASRNTSKFTAVFQYTEAATGAECYCYITREHTRHCYA